MLAKKQKLQEVLAGYLREGVILALSGGVDSALLLGVIALFPRAKREKFMAITFKTVLYPEDEMEIAKDLCANYQISHRLLQPEIEIPKPIQHNPQDRCYLCKQNLFKQVLEMAKAEGYQYILDGTNADDLKAYRPGKKALDELGVKSPLADCGFTKGEVRSYAAELGLSVADKPSGSCYATRFPYGAELDINIISKLAKLENFFRGFGLSQIRLRYHQPILRLELLAEEFPIFLKNRQVALKEANNQGFTYLTLDMAGFRSGSMDIDLPAGGDL